MAAQCLTCLPGAITLASSFSGRTVSTFNERRVSRPRLSFHSNKLPQALLPDSRLILVAAKRPVKQQQQQQQRRGRLVCRAEQERGGAGGEPEASGGKEGKTQNSGGEAAGEAAEGASPSPEQKQKQEEAAAAAGSAAEKKEEKGDLPFAGFSITPVWKKQEEEPQLVQLSKAVVDDLRNMVFGFDTFFVTSQEAYQGGVLFKGNLRGDSAKAFAKLKQKLEDKYGNEYALFLLPNPQEDGRPMAAVVPSESLQPLPAAVPEWAAAGAFGLVAAFTLLLRNSPSQEFGLLPTSEYVVGPLLDGLPGALVMAASLAVHEAAHFLVAKQKGLEIGVPYFIPSWQLGSFGGITRIKNIVQKRQDLAEVAAAGPLAGIAVALFFVLVGLLLPAGEQAIPLDASAFHDSVLVGGIAKLLLGDALKEGAQVNLNPIALAGWSALLINAINTIPAGEIDGGRIVHAVWGRKAASRLSLLAYGLLAFTGLFDDVALYWLVLIIFLQRGPVTPQADEVTPPDSRAVALGAGTLLLGLLIYCPLLVPFS